MKRFFSLRLRPAPGWTEGTDRDLALEGLRGLCALLVLYAHLFIPGRALDPAWAPSSRFWWLNLGSTAVLIFFLLSGYVIGITTRLPPTATGIRDYAFRRARRLFPIATAAVLISWAFQPSQPFRMVAGNFLFLQNSEPYPGLGLFPLLDNNPNLWSLNYELVYYIGFVLVWSLAPPLALVLVLMALLVIGHSLGFPIAAVFGRYACGGFYWMAGLAVAWLTKPTKNPDVKSNWPAALLAAYALWTVAPLRSLLENRSLYGWLWMTPASPHRLDFLPACLWILLAVTGRTFPRQRWMEWGCLAWTFLGLFFHLATHTGEETDLPALAALLAACLTMRVDASTALLRKLAPAGAISYGIYVMAAPLQWRQRELFGSFSGSALTFSIRATAVVFLVLGSAWLLERKLQPALVRRLTGRKAARS